jgi:CNT family concentrative nucleoside transporter
MDILRGLLGLIILVALGFVFSRNRRAINWKQVGIGVALQIVLALLILRVDLVSQFFDSISRGFVEVLGFTEAGAEFLFGKWPNNTVVGTENATEFKPFNVGYIFAFKVLPTVVFFSALSSLLYYLGILQIIIKGFAFVMNKTMGVSGAESLAAAANVFIGQTEAPLVIKPYIDNMTKSEIMCLMTGGMATIAGGVFAAYVGFLGGDDPVQQAIFAKHLLTASVISAPAAIVCAKLLYPEVEEINKHLEIPKEKLGSNVLDAISIGTTDGLKLAVNVGAMLLVFTALVAMLNWIMLGVGSIGNLNGYIAEMTNQRYTGLSLDYILGIIFAPIAWVIGIPNEDILLSGQLLGQKTAINEFFAYATLAGKKALFVHEKSIVIITYALCGFSNFASIGIQIGGIGALSPKQRPNLASLGILSLIGGTLACLMTAAIAGMLF